MAKSMITKFIDFATESSPVIVGFVESWKKVHKQRIELEAQKGEIDNRSYTESWNRLKRAELGYEREIQGRIPNLWKEFISKQIFDKAGKDVIQKMTQTTLKTPQKA